MAKICNKEGCNNPRFGGGFCRWHQGYRSDKGLGKEKTSPSKGNALSSKGKVSKIRPLSSKMVKRLAEYRIVRDEYLKDNPTCARCGTTNNLSLHHLAGREGNLLTDVDNFMTLCIPCHSWVTEFTKDAIKQGFAKSRLQKKSED